MRKQTIKKGWLLGLLVGLVMLVGASPALAGYMLLGDFCLTNPIIHEGTTYNYAFPGQSFTIPGIELTETKHEFDEDGDYNWDDWAGKFEYIVLKQGNCGENGFTELYKFVADPNVNDFNASHICFEDGTKVSHISGYNQVPIPAAFWLLGSGLGALLVARRRRKQV